MHSRAPARSWFLALLLSVVVAVVSTELFLAACLARPAWARSMFPADFFAFVRELHLQYERGIVHFDPSLAHYDRERFYALRPGAGRFASREFDTDFRVNRAGLRDDDASLDAPDVIVLGDSFAMGWGVEQQEAFPEVLERLSGLRVLNAGVSSYGTVRERMVLDHLDTSGLRLLIVQYHHSDYPENWLFRANGDRLPISSPEGYRATVEHEARRRRYFPGRWSFLLADRLVHPAGDAQEAGRKTGSDDAELFLHALLKAGGGGLPDVPLVVVAFGEDARGFLGRLRRHRLRRSYPPRVRALRTVDLVREVSPEDYYVLDDHLRASGHRRVAERLDEVIRSAP